MKACTIPTPKFTETLRETTSEVLCSYVLPVLTLAVYGIGIIAIHEVFYPSGRINTVPTLRLIVVPATATVSPVEAKKAAR